MNTLSKLIIAITGGSALMIGACSKEDSKSTPPTEPTTKIAPKPEPRAATEPTATTAPASAKNFAEGMMSAYEACRALLAADKVKGIGACATGIVDASKTAHAGAPDAAHEHIGTLVKAAEALAKLPTEDIEAVRLDFGKVSESVVAMLTAAPEAAKSYHVFECPMAKGYKRWAQPGSELENPYMGAKMLACGSEVHDHHAGTNANEEPQPAPAAHGSHSH